MSNYSEKSSGDSHHRRSSSNNKRRSSPTKRYRSRSPITRPRQSRSRSPHYDHHSRRYVQSRIPNSRYRSRSPLPHYLRPINKTREEELIRFNPPQNNVLAIFGLSKRVIEQDLFDLYKSFGCKECKVIMDKHTGCPKGYGFVYFHKIKDAIIAREKTDGKIIFGKPMRVDFSIGERDFTALSGPIRSSLYNRDSRDLRDRSSRYVEHHHSRDHRMPREPLNHFYHNERSLIHPRSPNNRYSPHKHASSYNNASGYIHHHHHHVRREVERRRVATPPLPPSHANFSNLLSDNIRNSYINRSRSRSFDRNRKYQYSSRSSHDLSHELLGHRQ